MPTALHARKAIPQDRVRTTWSDSSTASAGPAPVRVQDSAPAALATLCSNCHLKGLCLPCGLPEGDLQRLDAAAFVRRRIREGEPLYHQGDRFQSLYAVRSGTFKSYVTLREGAEHVTAFQMSGELLALDGLASGRHASSAVALEDGEVCAIGYAQLSELAMGSPALQQAITRLMSSEIVREHGLMTLLGSMSAEERLAAFLLNLSQRMKTRGYSPVEFHLRMSRADIGSYLGMKVETVSRAFSAFAERGLLQVDKRHVCIRDLAALRRAFDIRVI